MILDCIDEIPGAPELAAWYGTFPSLHDANVIDFHIGVDGSGFMVIDAFRTTSRVDENGYFILDKHFSATFQFENIETVSLSDFLPGQAILFDFKIDKSDTLFNVRFSSSYGFDGAITMKNLSVTFEPRSPSP
jgi:hypothetical protein